MKATLPIERITSKIYLTRDQKVMLDRDLAELYEVETRVLNQAVYRNKDRFPGDFMFELTRDEITDISQIVTSSRIKYSKRVTAFSEQGVAMLSSVLRSKRAIQVNIKIMRAFVQLRKIIGSHEKLEEKLRKIEHHIEDHDEKIETIFRVIQELIGPDEKPKKKRIGYTVKEKQATYGKKAKGKRSVRT